MVTEFTQSVPGSLPAQAHKPILFQPRTKDTLQLQPHKVQAGNGGENLGGWDCRAWSWDGTMNPRWEWNRTDPRVKLLTLSPSWLECWALALPRVNPGKGFNKSQLYSFIPLTLPSLCSRHHLPPASPAQALRGCRTGLPPVLSSLGCSSGASAAPNLAPELLPVPQPGSSQDLQF